MADYTPDLGNYTELKPFRYWCQKVLPLVYDDSLSYYELLCKVVDYLNKTMEDVETLHDDVLNLHAAYVQLQDYVNTYFDNLDVQEEINNKLDDMAQDGSLSALISPFIPDIVTDWLDEHVTPSTPIVDDTLTISEAAADAKKVGDALSYVYSSSGVYNVGDMCLYNGTLYKCMETISTAEAFDSDKWCAVNVTAEFNNLENIVEGNLISSELKGYYDDDLVFHNNNNWRTLMLPIEIATQYDTLTILKSTLTPYGENISSIAFFNADKEPLLLSKYNQPANTVFGFADIPENSKYVVFNTSNVAGFVIKTTSVLDLIIGMKKQLAGMTEKTVTINGLYNGVFQFVPVLIHKGDIIKIKATYNGGFPNIWFSNGNRNNQYIEAELISTADYNYHYITADKCWSGFTTWATTETGDKSWKFEITVISNKNAYTDKIVVSASNSKLDDKINSDLQCTGTDDQAIINRAIVIAQTLKMEKVILCDGDYYIDGYVEYTLRGALQKVCVCIHDALGRYGVTLSGDNPGKPHSSRLIVNEDIFDDLTENETLNIISGGSPSTGYTGGNGFSVENIEIVLPDSQHKVVAINNQWSYWGVIKNCFISCYGYGQDVLPAAGCVGVRGWSGWSDGIDIEISDVFVLGFYVGFQLGGEHLICKRCVARFNYYGYTFGEYTTEANSGAQVHPITLINCADEHMEKLPKFCKSGNANNPGAGLCGVNMINFNIEYYPLISETSITGATEDTVGGWCGIIDYTVESNEQNNRVDVPFWEGNNGVYFRTMNTAHKQIGTSLERLAYAANYMQMFYDTTLDKVLYCIDPDSGTWVDSQGTAAD